MQGPTVVWSQIDHLVTRDMIQGLRVSGIVSRPPVVGSSRFQRRSSRLGQGFRDQVGPREDQQSFGHKLVISSQRMGVLYLSPQWSNLQNSKGVLSHMDQ